MALPVRPQLVRGVVVSAVLLALTAASAAISPAVAGNITVTDAKIAAGRLIVTGTALGGDGHVTLDGKFTAPTYTHTGFSFNLVYLPPDCIVDLAVVGSSAPPTKAVVADCAGGGLNPRGAWRGAVTYNTDDVVTSLGSAWRALRTNLNKSPSSNPLDWEKFVSKGDNGTTGPTGPAGRDGCDRRHGSDRRDGCDRRNRSSRPNRRDGRHWTGGAAGLARCDRCRPARQGQRARQGQSAVGATGATGATGPAGTVLSFADFFALMPPDNAATVASGIAVSFPQDGPASGSDITRLSNSSFNLAAIGTYQVTFQVSVTEAGQLVLNANGAELAYTVTGRATGTSQITGTALVTTTTINTVLTLDNPVGSPVALTITPLAGGVYPVSAHLTILRLQ